MVFFDVRMDWEGSLFDVGEEFGSGVKPAAAFTPFQGVLADDFAPDGNGSDAVVICDLDGFGRTDVGAGSAADTVARCGDDVGAAIPVFQFQSFGPHQFGANPMAQMAPDASVRRGLGVKMKFPGDVMQDF